MPKKTIITKITLGVRDPERDTVEVRDPNGLVLVPASAGIAHKAPGEPVTLEAAEADAIVKRFGGEVLEEIPDEPATGGAEKNGKAAR